MAAPAGPHRSSQGDDEIAERLGNFLAEEDPETYGTPDEERKPAPAARESEEAKVGEPTDAKPDEKADEKADAKPDEKADAKPEDAGEEEGIESIADLAQVFETEESEIIDSLTVQPREGAEAVTLRQLIDRYNEPEDTAKIDEARGVYEARQRELEENFGKRADELQALTAGMIALMEFDQTEMKKLREVDPVRWAEMRDQADQRHAIVQQALKKFDEERQGYTQRGEEDLKAYYQREHEAIMRAMPAWRDESVCRAAFTQMEKTLKAVGFSQEEIENMSDHRAMQVAWKASEYDRLSAKSATVREKKLLKLPKGSIRRSARDEGGPAREAAAKQKAKWDAMKAGDEDAAASLFADTLDD